MSEPNPGAKVSEPNRTVAMVRSEPLQRFVSTAATANCPWRLADSRCAGRFRSGWRSGYAPRNHTREPSSKRTGQGREPEPKPGTGADQQPPPAVARAHVRTWFPPSRERKLQVPKGHTLCSHFLYLNTSNFHPMANVGLNAFSYL